jgi:hypothetical protein
MTRKTVKSAASKKQNKPNASLASSLVLSLLGLPRLLRMFIIGVFALAVTLVMSPIVDRLYLTYFFSMETRLLPSLVTVAFGAIMYAVGWWLVIAPDPDEPSAGGLVLWYVALGMLALFLTIILTIIGIIIGTEAT